MLNFRQYLKEEDLRRVEINLGNNERFIKKDRLIQDMPERMSSFIVDRQTVYGMDKGKVPKIVEIRFSMYGTGLTSLENGPIEAPTYSVSYNALTSLKYGPMTCSKEFAAIENDISSLQGIGKDFIRECGELDLGHNPLSSHLMGLFRIQGLDKVTLYRPSQKTSNLETLTRVSKIIYNHIDNPDREDGAIECIEELSEKGYREYAKF